MKQHHLKNYFLFESSTIFIFAFAAEASLANNSRDGILSSEPLSKRAITGWVVPAFLLIPAELILLFFLPLQSF